MKKYYLLFFVIISFLFGCSDNVISSEDQYDSAIDGQTITINTNQKFTLELDLHADGGYQWDYSISDTGPLGFASFHQNVSGVYDANEQDGTRNRKTEKEIRQ